MNAEAKQSRYVRFLTLLIIFAILLAARLLYLFLADAERFPINTIKIAAPYEHVSYSQFELILGKYLNNSFFSFPVRSLYQDLKGLGWVKKAQINRVWPDVLKITLVEKKPIATWNHKLLDKDGTLFKMGNEEKEIILPYLTGPVNQHQKVLQVYKKISKILSIYGLHAAALELQNDKAWRLSLTNGLQLNLGNQEIEERLTRFCRAYPAVFAEKLGSQRASIDLRYPRGMAVQWKNETGR